MHARSTNNRHPLRRNGEISGNGLSPNANTPIHQTYGAPFLGDVASGLTKKAEPPPTRDVNRDSGTASANGGWLRRLVRRFRVSGIWRHVGNVPSGEVRAQALT